MTYGQIDGQGDSYIYPLTNFDDGD